MELFSHQSKVPFMALRYKAMGLSLVFVLLGILGLFVNKLSFGIDFTGGVLIEVGYPEAVNLDQVRLALDKSGFPGATVQHFGSSRDVLIRMAPGSETAGAGLSEKVMAGLTTDGARVQLRRVEFVGPQVGEQLAVDGGLAVLYALVGILVYIGFRFEFRLATASVIALVHDVIITLGVFAWFKIEFDLTVLAALLAVIGYSINDAVVVFDRLRENFRRMRKESIEQLFDRAINETLSRTIMTSSTTFLVLLVLLFFGGDTIHGFALALAIGVIVGTYSSIYIASSVAMTMGISREDMLPTQKAEAGGGDGRP
jgi:preprotein translocase subunit SecF